MNIQKQIEKLDRITDDLYQQDFLLTWEKSESDLRMVLEVADLLKQMREKNISSKVVSSIEVNIKKMIEILS